MKTTFAITILVVSVTCSFCLASDEDTAARRERAKLAAKLLIGKLRERVEKMPIDKQYLSEKMKDEKTVSNYVSREGSRQALRQNLESRLRSYYADEVADIIRRFDADKPEDISSWFTDGEKKEMGEFPQAEARRNMDKNFDPVFNSARDMAVSFWKNKIASDVYPSETEVETMSNEALMDLLSDRLAKKQNFPVLEEVKNDFYNFINPVIADAREQQKMQRSIVENFSDYEHAARTDIETTIKSRIDSYRQKLQTSRENGNAAVKKVYETFISVNNMIPGKSRSIATEIFNNTLSNFNFEFTVDVIKSYMKNDINEHLDKEKSIGTITETFGKILQDQVVTTYVSKVHEVKRSELKSFAESLLSSNANTKNLRSVLVSKSLKNYGRARNELVNKQFLELFKPLAEGSWVPSVKEIDRHYNDGYYDIKIEEPLKMPGVSMSMVDSSQIFEEVPQMVLERERNAISEGISAMRKQMSIVENISIVAKSEATNTQTQPVYEDVLKLLSDKLSAKWAADEASKKYGVFQRATDQARKDARDIVDAEVKRRIDVAEKEKEKEKQKEIQRQIEIERQKKAEKQELERQQKEAERQAVAQTKQDSDMAADNTSKPGREGQGSADNGPGTSLGGAESKNVGQVGSGQGGGEGDGKGPSKEKLKPEEFPLDMVIDFEASGSVTHVTINFVKTGENREFNLGSTGNSNLNDIRTAFEKWLDSQQSNEKQGSLFVFARIFDTGVSYSSVYNVRENLRTAIRTTKNKFSIRWYDFMEDKKNKERRSYPETMRKSMGIIA